MPHTFVLNDETKTNSHGFRVLNAGINLERFLANPVLLDYHNPSNKSVIGRWVNLRTEGHLLLADAEFDSEDEDAAKIEGKVKRGFIKGASCGLGISNAKWELIDDVPTLAMCELTEASVVSIPSNANALKLYAKDGEDFNLDEIKLSISELVKTQKPKETMKLSLAVGTLVTLGLQADDLQSPEKLQAAIENLASKSADQEVKLNAVTAERDALKTKIQQESDAKATALVELAVKEGRITAEQKDKFVTLAKNDFATAEGVLNAIPKKQNLSATNSQEDSGEVKNLEDFMKLDDAAKLAFKAANPEAYQKLF